MVYTQHLKCCGLMLLWVRVPPWVPIIYLAMERFNSEYLETMQKFGPEILDNIESFFEKPEAREAFAPVENIIGCVDEGIPARLSCYTAGSFITLPDNEAVNKIRENSAESFSTHKGCGACALVAKQKGAEPSAYLEEWATKMESETGKKRSEHYENMDRPEGMHDARVAYLVGTERFSHVNSVWPKGFIVTLSQGAPASDLELVLSIAFGDHGQGDNLTEQNPFRIVILGGDMMSAEEIENTVSQYIPEDKKSRIKVISTTVPSQMLQETTTV